MKRDTELISMPLPDNTAVLRPQAAVLNWGDRADGTLDIGRLCYLRRNESRHLSSRSVDVNSLCAEREGAIRNLITCISELQTSGGLRPRTVHTKVRKIIEFVNWADKWSLQNVLTSKEQTLSAMQQYFDHLRDRVSRNEIKKSPASTAQSAVRALLADLFEDDNFGMSVRRLQIRRHDVEHTTLPDEKSQGLLISWVNELFVVISSHLMEFKPYPFLVKGPNQHFEEIKMWLWPCEQGYRNRGFNQETGEVRSYAELKEIQRARGIKHFMSSAGDIHLAAKNYLIFGNSNPYTSIRLNHAHLAMLCFAAMLLAETGTNRQQLLDLKWDQTLVENLKKLDVVRQGFREIKWRAGGKDVTITVSIGFLPMLRQFLEFRDYLLRGDKANKLLFFLDENGKDKLFPPRFLTNLYDRLKTLRIDLPPINARQWRAAKGDWAQRNHGPIVAAKLLGHKLETAMESYANGTEGKHREEMTSFLGSLEKTILNAGENPPGMIQSAIGGCTKFKSPKAISQASQIKPTCHSTEGCLFCHQYRIHADEIDIRKLISCRYCIRQACSRVSSLSEYDTSFGVVLKRINFLLEELKKRDAALVNRIEEDVDLDGNLDAFWTSKLEQLFELGIV